MLIISQFVYNNRTAIHAHLKDTLVAARDDDYPMEFNIKDLLDELQINYSSINSSFNAFLDLGDEDWSPILRVPFKSNLIINNQYTTAHPLFAIADYSISRSEETAAVYVQHSGTLVPYTGTLTETNVFNVLLYYVDIDNWSGNGSNPNPTLQRLKINKLTPKHHKESWLAGKSEVHFKGYKLSFLPSTSGD